MEPYNNKEPFIKMKLSGTLLDRLVEAGIPLTRALQYFRDNPEGSASETAKLVAEEVVPFYYNYRNNGDLSDYAKEAAMLAMPLPKGSKYAAIRGRDGKLRYIADEIIKPDVEKNLEFRRVTQNQLKPFEQRNIDVNDIGRRGGPYFDTPDYGQSRVLSPNNAYGWDTSIPTEFRDYDGWTGTMDQRTYSNNGLKPENINRTLSNAAPDIYKRSDPDKPINKDLIKRGTPEWDEATKAAKEYEEFIRNAFNDRTSYVGKATVDPTGIGNEVNVKYGDMTPKQIYDEFVANNQDLLNVKLNEILEPEMFNYPNVLDGILDALNDPNKERQMFEGKVRNANRDIENALENRLIGPGSTNTFTGVTDTRSPVGMRMSDYKNILESLSYNTKDYKLRQEIERVINNMKGDLITDTERTRMLDVFDTYAKLYKETEPSQRSTLVKAMLNDLNAAGLMYNGL